MEKAIAYVPVEGSPVKSFFVEMLTRDIGLEEAILDLLDNCVDGIHRLKNDVNQDRPYKGFRAEITFDADTFTISDNCGGIPWNLHDYAFRMGRAHDYPQDVPGTVGIYGIGLKRAVFKMGKSVIITTRNGADEYEVVIDPEWTTDEDKWKIPVRPAEKTMENEGTFILIGDLNPGIKERFGEGVKTFQQSLVTMVSTHYSYIIEKGFEVIINGAPIPPRTTKIRFDSSQNDEAIRPFIFKTKTEEGVEVFLTVGFTRQIPSENIVLDEQEEAKYSSDDAGWTILCNDRAVLYCDRTILTGWGDYNVPKYHTQFIAISGIVEFRSEDPSKLPTTTTKRGVDASSPLYIQTKNKMREGMRLFTDYTNKWKGRTQESQEQIKKGKPLSFYEIKEKAKTIQMNPTSREPIGTQFRPHLPQPQKDIPTKRRIFFVKEIRKIRTVAEYFDNPDMEPSEVGEKCFDFVYEEAQK